MFKKLTPNIMVNNVRESVLFYIEILGFTLNLLVPTNSKAIEDKLEEGKEYSYAMVSRDEIFFMLMEKKAFGKDLPMLENTSIGASASFYCDISNIDDFYNSIRNKIKIAIDLHTTWYGMREFYIKDCNGYVLCFAEAQNKR